MKVRSEKEQYFDMKKKGGYLPANAKTTKINLFKTSSKSKLAKAVKTTINNENQGQFVYEEVETEPDMNTYKSFRKGIINKIYK